jgi:DNA-binding MarR family transcriptional regulator
MSKLVDLVNQYDAFEKTNKSTDIADFCRYYLAKEKGADESLMVKGAKPPSDEALMMKTMGYIISAFGIYFRAAMIEAKLPFPEAFYFLNSLHWLKQAKKTELINYTMVEYTTGMDCISKLVKDGLISEKPHETDKRAKMLHLTAEGERLLQFSYPYMHKACQMIFKDFDPQMLKLCISLLSNIEIKHSHLAIAVRHLDFESMYKEVMAEK